MNDEIKYEDKRCQRFNQSIDVDGEIQIAGFSSLPSRILFEMDIEAYKEAFNEFIDQEYEELKEVVYKDYPSCIAFNLRLSEKGQDASDPVRKLLHLKDIWESIVFVINAIVWAEVRFKNINLKTTRVLVSTGSGGNPVYENFSQKRLLTDAIKTKIQNVKSIINHSITNNLNLKCEQIEIDLLDELMELQDIRNDISHHQIPSNEQAIEELKLVTPLFKEMLVKTNFLEDCKILRFESFSAKCKCESFNGHSLNKEFDDFDFGTSQTYVIGLGQEQLFLKWDNEIYSLSPFLHYEKDTLGFESFMCFYKGKKDSKFWYEPVKIRKERVFDHLQTRFDSEKDAIINLIAP